MLCIVGLYLHLAPRGDSYGSSVVFYMNLRRSDKKLRRPRPRTKYDRLAATLILAQEQFLKATWISFAR